MPNRNGPEYLPGYRRLDRHSLFRDKWGGWLADMMDMQKHGEFKDETAPVEQLEDVIMHAERAMKHRPPAASPGHRPRVQEPLVRNLDGGQDSGRQYAPYRDQEPEEENWENY